MIRTPAAVPSTADELLELLRRSGIHPDDVLTDRLRNVPSLPADPGAAAAVLVQHGLITRFQAKLLLTGRYRGFKLGQYVIQEQIGQGGMGAVYLAEHEQLRRRVAIKVLTPPKADANGKLALERFLREARSAAALDHPNIVRLHDVGRQGDVHFLVLEYVEGDTLEGLIEKGGAVAPGRAVGYIAQAAAGLQHAYERGFVHRDIKPSNLILAKDGTVKILDMGLARSFTGEGDKLTERMDEGAIVGTADFISPEQAMNSPTVDIRSDIYSLGATFFALVTGKPPFGGNTTQKLVQHQMKDPPSLDALDRTFPAELARVAAKMMAKKPEKRYQTPAELIRGLAPWLGDAGGAKVVAGLSGTDLAGTVEMQNTISELAANNTTGRLGGRSKRLGAAGRTPWAVWGGTTAAVVAAVGLVLYAVFAGVGGKDQVTAAGMPSYGPASQPTRPPEPPPAVPAAVPQYTTAATVAPLPPAAPGVVYRFDAGIIPDCRFEIRGLNAGGKPAFPAGYDAICWRPESTGEFVRTVIDGRPAVGVASRTGDPTAQFNIGLEDGVGVALLPDHEYRVRAEYMTRGGAGGALVVHDPKHDYKITVQCDFERTDGVWKSCEARFVRPADGLARLAVDARPATPDGMLFVRLIEVIDTAPPPAYRATFAGVTPVRVEARNRSLHTDQIDGRLLPTGWGVNHYDMNADSEYLVADVGGVRAFGMKNKAGGVAQVMVVMNDFFDQLAGGRAGTFRIEYQYEGAANAWASVQMNRDPWTKSAQFPLPATSGQWQAVDMPVARPTDTDPYAVVINSGGGPCTLWVRAVEARVAGGAAAGGAAAGGAAYRLDLAGRPTFSARGRSEPTGDPAEDVRFVEITRSGSGGLPAGWRGIAWDGDGEAEFLVVGDKAGRPALGMRNVRLGTKHPQGFTGMLFSPRMELPGGRCKVRFDYLTDGNTGGQFRFKQTAPAPKQAWTIEDLPATNGQWRTWEREVSLQGATGGYFELHSFDGDPTRGFYIASFEAGAPGAAPPAAAGPAAGDREVFRLAAADVAPFRNTKTGSEVTRGVKETLPKGVYFFGYKTSTVAEYWNEPTDGGKAFGWAHQSGDASGQIGFELEGGDTAMNLPLVEGRKYRLRVTYRAVGGAAGAAYVQTTGTYQPIPGDCRVDLPGTNGDWRTAEVVWTKPAGKVRMLVDNFAGGPAAVMSVREVTLSEVGAAPAATIAPPPASNFADGATLFALDLPAGKPFRYTIADGKADGADPGAVFPAGVSGHCWKKGSVAEFRGVPANGRLAVGVTNLNDDVSSQLQLQLEGGLGLKLQPNREYKVRVEYRTENDAAGAVTVRDPAFAPLGRAELPATGGEWKTAELTFRRPADRAADAVVENTAVGEGNTLYVRGFELIERK
jgi:tRNA A-37 threonylcarbamoyl transferase component Bud32